MSKQDREGGFWPSLYDKLRGGDDDVGDWFTPVACASATDDCYSVCVELPGVTEADFTVTVEDESLVLEGDKQPEPCEDSTLLFFNERRHGHFVRSFKLPPDADLVNYSSTLENGVLRLIIPRRSSPKPRPEPAIRATA
jgi:HSP20 family protein